jgi:hypothetical protein
MDDMSNMDMSNMDMHTMASPTPTLTDAQTAALTAGYGIFMVIITIISVAILWKIFVKAGQAGWKAIIPIYDQYILLKIIGRPGWWLLLSFIPLVNVIVAIVIALELGRAFGRSKWFSIFLLVIFPIGYLILAFGSTQYLGPKGEGKPSSDGPSDPSGSSASSPPVTLTEAPAPAVDQPQTPPAA